MADLVEKRTKSAFQKGFRALRSAGRLRACTAPGHTPDPLFPPHNAILNSSGCGSEQDKQSSGLFGGSPAAGMLPEKDIPGQRRFFRGQRRTDTRRSSVLQAVDRSRANSPVDCLAAALPQACCRKRISPDSAAFSAGSAAPTRDDPQFFRLWIGAGQTVQWTVWRQPCRRHAAGKGYPRTAPLFPRAAPHRHATILSSSGCGSEQGFSPRDG
jgi:hypothetical protein